MTSSLASLCFLFNITPVRISVNCPERRVGPHNHWTPPVTRNCFLRDQTNSTGWYKWTPNPNEARPWSNPVPERQLTCSIFFDKDINQFLLARNDCSQENVSDSINEHDVEQAGWCRVAFEHSSTRDHRDLSIVRFDPADDYILKSRGGPSWMPQLIPSTYDNPRSDRYTDLAGELPILLGFAAFTCEPRRADIIDTIRSHFRLPRWIPHQPNPHPSTSKFSKRTKKEGKEKMSLFSFHQDIILHS
jgi:hypothetical protein